MGGVVGSNHNAPNLLSTPLSGVRWTWGGYKWWPRLHWGWFMMLIIA